MIRALRITVFVMAAAALSACSTGESIKSDNPQLLATPDKASLMLAVAANKASTALETLAAVEQARTPEIAVGPINNAPSELRRAISVNWVGPVEPIAMKLASRAGYKFQAVGNEPPVPIVVSVNVENKPVIEVLRSLGLQLGSRADIKVDGQNRMVEVHYAPNSSGVGG